MTVVPAMAYVAGLYDYDLSTIGRTKVYVLRKRYTNADDLPSVSPEEMCRSFQELETGLSSFRPDLHLKAGQSRGDSLVVDIVRGLSLREVALMQEKKLRYKDLNPEVQAMVRRTSSYLYLENVYSDITRAKYYLNRLNNSKLFVSQPNESGLIYKGDDGREVSVVFKTMGVVNLTPLPASAKSTPESSEGNRTTSVTTIGKLLSEVKSNSDRSLVVADGLENKEVSAFGYNGAEPTAVLQGIAAIYGLRVAEVPGGTDEKKKAYKLEYRKAKYPTAVAEIPEFVMSVLPDPVIHAYIAKQDRSQNTNVTQLGEDSAKIPQMRPRNSIGDIQTAMKYADSDLSQAIADIPKQSGIDEKASEKYLPFGKLDNKAKSELSLILAFPALSTIVGAKLPYSVPDFMTRLDESYVTGGPYKDSAGKQKVGIFIGFLDEKTGEVQPATGTFDYDYQP